MRKYYNDNTGNIIIVWFFFSSSPATAGIIKGGDMCQHDFYTAIGVKKFCKTCGALIDFTTEIKTEPKQRIQPENISPAPKATPKKRTVKNTQKER